MTSRARTVAQETILAAALSRARPPPRPRASSCSTSTRRCSTTAHARRASSRTTGASWACRRSSRRGRSTGRGGICGSRSGTRGSRRRRSRAHAAPARRFWAEWFFTSAYCRLDAAVPGAARLRARGCPQPARGSPTSPADRRACATAPSTSSTARASRSPDGHARPPPHERRRRRSATTPGRRSRPRASSGSARWSPPSTTSPRT